MYRERESIEEVYRVFARACSKYERTRGLFEFNFMGCEWYGYLECACSVEESLSGVAVIYC